MTWRTGLLELLLSGFFAVACLKCWTSVASGGKADLAGLLRFPDRLERLRRSRWQWCAMVLLMLVLRLQNELPLILEIAAACQFLLFTALPAFSPSDSGTRRQANAASVGSR